MWTFNALELLLEDNSKHSTYGTVSKFCPLFFVFLPFRHSWRVWNPFSPSQSMCMRQSSEHAHINRLKT